MRSTTVVEPGGKTATGLVVPPEVVEALGAGGRPPGTVALGWLAALDAEPGARGRFDALPPSHRKEHVRAVESARAEATTAVSPRCSPPCGAADPGRARWSP